MEIDRPQPSFTGSSQDSVLLGHLSSLLSRRPVIMQLLRFGAIGFLNTALSFIISNLISKYFNIQQGGRLGIISGVGFIFATAQSYYWNKYWAFGSQSLGLLQNVLRLVFVGATGVLSLVLVYVGSLLQAPYYYYIFVFLVFVVAQAALWFSFKFSQAKSKSSPMLPFFTVSVVGFLINAGIASVFSSAVSLSKNGDLNKNAALVVASAVSLIWNFVGYKALVFRK